MQITTLETACAEAIRDMDCAFLGGYSIVRALDGAGYGLIHGDIRVIGTDAGASPTVFVDGFHHAAEFVEFVAAPETVYCDMTYLNHLTLNTGHARRSWRHEVAADAVNHTRELLADAIAAGGDADMPVHGYRLHVEPFGDRRAMLATVARGEHKLVAIGIAARPAKGLWGQLIALQHRLYPDLPMPDQPDAPWCAALLLPALTQDHSAQAWLGDFERCAAWAWIGGAA